MFMNYLRKWCLICLTVSLLNWIVIDDLYWIWNLYIPWDFLQEKKKKNFGKLLTHNSGGLQMTNFLSFTSVLLCNKIPQMGWLKSTQVNYLICSVGLKSGHGVAGFSVQPFVAEIKMLAGVGSGFSSKFTDCCQTSFPYNPKTEVPIQTSSCWLGSMFSSLMLPTALYHVTIIGNSHHECLLLYRTFGDNHWLLLLIPAWRKLHCERTLWLTQGHWNNLSQVNWFRTLIRSAKSILTCNIAQ